MPYRLHVENLIDKWHLRQRISADTWNLNTIVSWVDAPHYFGEIIYGVFGLKVRGGDIARCAIWY